MIKKYIVFSNNLIDNPYFVTHNNLTHKSFGGKKQVGGVWLRHFSLEYSSGFAIAATLKGHALIAVTKHRSVVSPVHFTLFLTDSRIISSRSYLAFFKRGKGKRNKNRL